MPVYMNFTVNGHTLNLGNGQIYGMVCAGKVITPFNLAHLRSSVGAQSRATSSRASGVGSGGGRSYSNSAAPSLVFQRGRDLSSPLLVTHLGKQRVYSSLGVNLVQGASFGISVPLATLTLINAVLTSYLLPHSALKGASPISWSGSDGDEACKEEVTFEYGGFHVKYFGGTSATQGVVRSKSRIPHSF